MRLYNWGEPLLSPAFPLALRRLLSLGEVRGDMGIHVEIPELWILTDEVTYVPLSYFLPPG